MTFSPRRYPISQRLLVNSGHLRGQGKQCLLVMLGLLGLVTLALGQQCLLLNASKGGLDCVEAPRLIDLLKLHSQPNTLT